MRWYIEMALIFCLGALVGLLTYVLASWWIG